MRSGEFSRLEPVDLLRTARETVDLREIRFHIRPVANRQDSFDEAYESRLRHILDQGHDDVMIVAGFVCSIQESSLGVVTDLALYLMDDGKYGEAIDLLDLVIDATQHGHQARRQAAELVVAAMNDGDGFDSEFKFTVAPSDEVRFRLADTIEKLIPKTN